MAVEIGVTGSVLDSELVRFLMCDSIQPGSELSYQMAKIIYLYHPLGRKMVEAPLTMAQSQPRDIAIQESEDEVVEAFTKEWGAIGADKAIHNFYRISRIYGLSSLVVLTGNDDPSKPLDMATLAKQDLAFNVLDPLNTAGSLVLSQIPTSPDFNRPVTVRSNGKSFHPTRFIVGMNEEPVYISYTTSAFGFVGRSVYLRAIYPLKTFLRSMVADDMLVTKAGVMIAKIEQPGSIVNKVMQAVASIKRNFLKEAQTGQVLMIGKEEDIATLNMQNAEAAAGYGRTNCLKNIATAADMPAKLLENETMVAGFGEGTEDAKNIAAYIDSIRMDMQPAYRWFDNIVMYRAWTQEFYERVKAAYPEKYEKISYEEAFATWRENFQAIWPSVLREPESEQEKSEKTKLDAVIQVLQTLLDQVDPANKAALIQAALDNISENKHMFPHEFTLDFDTLRPFLEEQQKAKQDAAKAANEARNEPFAQTA